MGHEPDLATAVVGIAVVSEPAPGRRLPPRPPRSFSVHWLVDAAVAFVAVAFLALLVGIPLVPLALVAMGVGLVAAPYTRRAEIRALAARADGVDPSGGTGGPRDGPDSTPA